MKIRTGFVSNSSSSSFCILGICRGITSSEIEKFKFSSKLSEEELEEIDSIYDIEDCKEFNYDASELEFTPMISDEYNYVFGKDIHKLDENISISKNKEKIAAKLSEYYKEPIKPEEISFIVDGGFDG